MNIINFEKCLYTLIFKIKKIIVIIKQFIFEPKEKFSNIFHMQKGTLQDRKS